MGNLDKLQTRMEQISFNDLMNYINIDTSSIRTRFRKSNGILGIVLLILIAIYPIFIIAYGWLTLLAFPVIPIVFVIVELTIYLSQMVRCRSLLRVVEMTRDKIVCLVNDIRTDRLSDVDSITDEIDNIKSGIIKSLGNITKMCKISRYDKYSATRDLLQNYAMVLSTYESDIMADLHNVNANSSQGVIQIGVNKLGKSDEFFDNND